MTTLIEHPDGLYDYQATFELVGSDPRPPGDGWTYYGHVLRPESPGRNEKLYTLTTWRRRIRGPRAPQISR